MPVQDMAEAKFAVRGTSEGLPGTDRVSGSLGQLIALNDSQEAHIVAAYINSSAIILSVSRGADLHTLFGAAPCAGSRPLWPESEPEEALAYWRQQVEADVNMISGVTTLRVRACAPEAAISLSRRILTASETLANSLSARVKASAIAASESEVDKAVRATQEAERAELRFRDERGLLDPSATAASVQRLIEQLLADRRRMETQVSVSSETAGRNSPVVETLKRRVASLDREMDRVRSSLTSGAGNDQSSVSSAIQTFDRLEFDREIAEQRLLAARADLARQQSQAARRRIYLEAYDPPALVSPPSVLAKLIRVATGSGVLAGIAILALAGLRDFGSA